MRQVIERYGRPLAFYHDRHSTFRPTKPTSRTERLAAQLEGKDDQHLETHFGRLLGELEITSIAARSPQAKGRVERLFGTLQQRLVIELRLANASSLQQANAFLQDYLPRFNAQFAVPAEQEGSVYRPLPAQMQMQEAFCFKYERTVGADHVVRFAGQRLQVQPDKIRRSYAHAKVEVHERLDGSLAIYYQGRCLKTTQAPAEAPLLRARSGSRPAGCPSASSRQELNLGAGSASKETRSSQQGKASSPVTNPRSPWRKDHIVPIRT